jgi:cytidylate kinase
MSVITISRGSFTGGKMLAECLATRLGYRCIDRDVIVERAAAHGVSQSDLRDAMEKPPGFLERFSHKRYKYLALVQASLAEEVKDGRAIYHGLAGHLLLGGGRHVLRTRIIAPLEYRVRMVRERLNYSRNEAIAYIEKMDEQRRRWTSFLYGVDWGDPSLYDLVLNLEHMALETACEIITAAARRRCFQMTPECQRSLEELALASKVKATLAITPSTEDLEVEVTADRGVVVITGKVPSLEQFAEVERVAKSVPGVTVLNLDRLAPPVQV